jgi:uncharacterized protein
MNAIKILEKYYDTDSECYKILLSHSKSVARKAVSVGKKFKGRVDLAFLEEASLLHDIGIFLTDAQNIDCHGDKPYLQHGILGREILEKEGYPKHGLVCERHIGVGLSKNDITKNNLPLPERDMQAKTTEEEIIAYADKFFSKSKENLIKEKTVEEIKNELQKYGPEKIEKFLSWQKKFNK